MSWRIPAQATAQRQHHWQPGCYDSALASQERPRRRDTDGYHLGCIVRPYPPSLECSFPHLVGKRHMLLCASGTARPVPQLVARTATIVDIGIDLSRASRMRLEIESGVMVEWGMA